jgi:hypothetical protein
MTKEQIKQFKTESEDLSLKAKGALDTFQKAIAAMPGDVAVSPQDMKTICENLYGSMSYLHDRISNLATAMYNHSDNGHLPPIPSNSHMQKALKVLGLDSEYESAPKRTVYAGKAEYIVGE